MRALEKNHTISNMRSLRSYETVPTRNFMKIKYFQIVWLNFFCRILGNPSYLESAKLSQRETLELPKNC